MKTKDLVRAVEEMGWKLARVAGSHHVFTHPKMKRNLPIPVHGKDVPDIIAKKILKQAKENIQE